MASTQLCKSEEHESRRQVSCERKQASEHKHSSGHHGVGMGMGQHLGGAGHMQRQVSCERKQVSEHKHPSGHHGIGMGMGQHLGGAGHMQQHQQQQGAMCHDAKKQHHGGQQHEIVTGVTKQQYKKKDEFKCKEKKNGTEFKCKEKKTFKKKTSSCHDGSSDSDSD